MNATQQPISATVPDWTRESKPFWAWMPTKSLLASLRAHEKWSSSTSPVRRPMRAWAALRHRWWSVVTGTDIPLGCSIGGGLRLNHGNGVVIHSDAKIGPNCLIFQQVTVGVRGAGAPRIGGHVDIGAGAKILGDITLGDHCKIGANAVVLIDVPAYGTAVGVPASVILPSVGTRSGGEQADGG